MTAAMSTVDRYEAPNPLWYVAIHGGLGTLAAMSLSQGAYDAISKRVPVPSRRAVQVLWLGSGALHVAEAAVAFRMAKARGMEHSAPRWAAETFFIGFPGLLKLREVAGR